MKISYNWLQEHIEEKLPNPEVLAEKIIFHAFEIETTEKISGDTIFDVKILPDRAGDCLSHLGVAREVSGLFGLTLKEKKYNILPDIKLPISLEVQSDLCRRYIAVRIDGVKVGPSPEHLKNKLESLGQRSVNNIVDIANIVMYDRGQPVHAFDAEKIDGGIIVRLAKDAESIKLLGGEEKTLSSADLVISDYLGILAIAGVKGGENAEVTDRTTSIVIEVANFDATAVRKTSRRLNLITDASKRFENNFLSVSALDSMQQIVQMVLESGGGVISGVHDENKNTEKQTVLEFLTSDVARLLGNGITEKNIEDVFKSYKYEYKITKGTFSLSVPYWRQDLIAPCDIAEEVGRFIGYGAIPSKPLTFSPINQPNENDIKISFVRDWCVKNGYREIYNYTFTDKGEVKIAYGSKGRDALRSELSDGLKRSYEFNRINAPLLGLNEVKLFEVGTVFLKDKEEMRIATCDKGVIQELAIEDFISGKNINLDVSNITCFSGLNIKNSTFKTWSQYPFITRDIAIWVDSKDDRNRLEVILEKFAEKYCIQEPLLFDEFSKDSRTSLAFRFIFQSQDRTLTDEEVNNKFLELTNSIKAEKAFEIR